MPLACLSNLAGRCRNGESNPSTISNAKTSNDASMMSVDGHRATAATSSDEAIRFFGPSNSDHLSDCNVKMWIFLSSKHVGSNLETSRDRFFRQIAGSV